MRRKRTRFKRDSRGSPSRDLRPPAVSPLSIQSFPIVTGSSAIFWFRERAANLEFYFGFESPAQKHLEHSRKTGTRRRRVNNYTNQILFRTIHRKPGRVSQHKTDEVSSVDWTVVARFPITYRRPIKMFHHTFTFGIYP